MKANSTTVQTVSDSVKKQEAEEVQATKIV